MQNKNYQSSSPKNKVDAKVLCLGLDQVPPKPSTERLQKTLQKSSYIGRHIFQELLFPLQAKKM